MPLGGGATLALAGASIAGPVIGGIIGAQQSAAAREAAQRAAQAAYDEINKIGAPPDQSKAIILKHFQQAGLLTPELEKQIDVGFSQVSKIVSDQNSKKAQLNALQLIKERANGGLTPEDRAQFNQMHNQVETATQGRLGAIKQNMAQRGMGGSGAELAQELAESQGATNQESQEGDQIAAAASRNALEAALQSGQLAGQMNAQDFAQQQAKASAADQFKMFDVQNQVSQQARNVGAENNAQQYNLGNQQGISNANVTMDNAEKERQVAAQRQYWQDQAGLAGMKANAKLGQASNLQSQADATAKQYAGIGAGIGAGAGAGLNYLSKQPAAGVDPSKMDGTSSLGSSGSSYTDTNYKMPEIGSSASNPVKTFSQGGMIPGQAEVHGDSVLNDKVPILASPGEAVIPKSIMDLGPEAGYGFLKAMIHGHKPVKKAK